MVFKVHGENEMIGYVYLLHFDAPYRHARHYLGYTVNLDQRMAMHAAGRGARLLEVLKTNGIHWTVAWVQVGDRTMERRLKNQHNTPRLCPICNPRKDGASCQHGR